MQTFHIEKEAVTETSIEVKGEIGHHIGRVLRVRVGESLRFSDNEALYYEGSVTAVSGDTVTVAVEKIYPIDDEPRLSVTLLQCLPRGDKMEQVLQKTTELGVKRVIPVESDNSQIRLKNKKEEKQKRWQKIVDSAAEQSGRGIIPVVETPCGLKTALDALSDTTEILFCYERETDRGFRATAEELKAKTTEIALIIGPEGGFSPAEAEMILAHGGHSVTMGSRILRTETAGPTALAALMYEFGEWERSH